MFTQTIPGAANIEVEYPEGFSGSNAVTVANTSAGLQVECETSVPGKRVAIHASASYVCPEQLVAFSLAPGESVQWSRRYVFGVSEPRPSR